MHLMAWPAGFTAHKTSVVGLARYIRSRMVSGMGGFSRMMGWHASNLGSGGALGSMMTIYDDLEIPQAST